MAVVVSKNTGATNSESKIPCQIPQDLNCNVEKSYRQSYNPQHKCKVAIYLFYLMPYCSLKVNVTFKLLYRLFIKATRKLEELVLKINCFIFLKKIFFNIFIKKPYNKMC